VAPGTYKMTRPKSAFIATTRGTAPAVAPPTTSVRVGGPVPEAMTGGVPVRILDRGPNQRVWTMDILCTNTLKRYDGSAMGPIGEQLRGRLMNSYEKVATLLDYTGPEGYTFQVVFTQIVETISDLRTQVLGVDYLMSITLTEGV
jgi:hypothetical protein